MAEVSSSVGDPIFFMHHTFVDHTFRIGLDLQDRKRRICATYGVLVHGIWFVVQTLTDNFWILTPKSAGLHFNYGNVELHPDSRRDC
ncbi:hypothetical protein F5Y17DRAFT_463912 [Xylariaceae sp. FL0594]|nr:hypothetical protein F5Y17DRAFT_463912 [Xylariaceae sp. FL0594]